MFPVFPLFLSHDVSCPSSVFSHDVSLSVFFIWSLWSFPLLITSWDLVLLKDNIFIYFYLTWSFQCQLMMTLLLFNFNDLSLAKDDEYLFCFLKCFTWKIMLLGYLLMTSRVMTSVYCSYVTCNDITCDDFTRVMTSWCMMPGVMTSFVMTSLYGWNWIIVMFNT